MFKDFIEAIHSRYKSIVVEFLKFNENTDRNTADQPSPSTSTTLDSSSHDEEEAEASDAKEVADVVVIGPKKWFYGDGRPLDRVYKAFFTKYECCGGLSDSFLGYSKSEFN